MKLETVGIISILIWELLIGISPLVYKMIHPAIPSSVVVAIRFGIAACVLLVWKLVEKPWKKPYIPVSWKVIGGLAFLGAFGSGFASLWNVVAIRNIGVILATLLTNLELPLGVFLGFLMLKEHITPMYLKILVIICFGYVLLIVKNGISLPSGGLYSLGVLVALGAAGIWGMCTLVGKKILKTSLSPVDVTLWRMLFGTMTNIVVLLTQGNLTITQVSHIATIDWIYLFWLGAVTSGLGYVLYYKALNVLPVKKISLFFPISTVVSVLLGFGSGEFPLISQWIGIIFIVSGITFLFINKEHI
ncbi:MAG: DMT family transporter [Candidatus Gottesmanbacteria bacterium]